MSRFDNRHFRDVLGCYPTGVCVITTLDADGLPVGMAVGTFTSVSLDPPLVAFLPDRRSSTMEHIRAAGRFCVNVLAEGQVGVSRIFGGRQPDKFASVAHRTSPAGMPLLDGAVAWIDCAVYAVHEAGDHFIVLGDVEDLAVESNERPLVFHRGDYGLNSSMLQAA